MKLLSTIGALCAILASSASAESPVITLPVRFHIIQGVTMEVKGQKMDMWVKPADVKGPLLTEINRIWKPADIQFVIERIDEETALNPPDRDGLLEDVRNAKRVDKGESDDNRVAKIMRFFDPSHWHKTALNVYLFPYIGGTFQGVAQGGGNRLIVGVWTDKPSHGTKPPVQTLLVEPEPMRVGSLGRTLSHELGHNLGLKHPGPDNPATDLLMGGRKQGYLLTPAQIATAKESAKKHLTAEPREFAAKKTTPATSR